MAFDFANNPAFSPANLLTLSGNILAGPNFASGLGTGLQQLATNVAAQQKEQNERQKLMQEQTQAANYLRQQNPGMDLSNFTPGMINAAASSTLDKKLNPAKPEFKVLDDGTYGTWDGTKFNVLGRASKPAELPAEYRDYLQQQQDPAYKAHVEEERRAKNAPTEGDRFKSELDTMKSYRSEKPVENYETTRAAYERMRGASQLGTGQGDIAIIYSYMKMLDPTSVVREGEYATAQNTSGVPEGIIAKYNQLLEGDKLTPEQRTEFINAGAVQYNDAVSALNETNKRYKGFADAYGVPQDRFMVNPKVFEDNPPGVVDFREFFK